jgi:hypothetical protein
MGTYNGRWCYVAPAMTLANYKTLSGNTHAFALSPYIGKSGTTFSYIAGDIPINENFMGYWYTSSTTYKGKCAPGDYLIGTDLYMISSYITMCKDISIPPTKPVDARYQSSGNYFYVMPGY